VESSVHGWLDHPTDIVTIPKLTIAQLANIVRNMDVETTRYTYHVVREVLIWVHYLERATVLKFVRPLLENMVILLKIW